MPFELYLLWRQYPWDFGEVVCDAKVLTQETITYSSIFTILAFTVERYLGRNSMLLQNVKRWVKTVAQTVKIKKNCYPVRP